MSAELYVNQAALLNAEAVHALTVGNAGVAYQKLKQALQILSHAADVNRQQSGSLPEDDKCWHQRIISSCPVPGLNGGRRQEAGDFYVCDNALLFNLLDEDVIDSTVVAICCQCTMFNMALTVHQRGMATGERRNFTSAGRLYEQCLRLSEEILGPADDVNMMAMACWNNLAHLQYTLGAYEEAVENLREVHDLVSDTDMEGCVSQGLAHVLQLDDVILNVLVTSQPTTAPCA